MTRPRNPALEAAMQDALAVVGAHGRATRLAMDATADWYDPAQALLIRRLLTYAWATRNRGNRCVDVAWHRDLARNAIRCYRALRGERRQAGDGRRMAA